MDVFAIGFYCLDEQSGFFGKIDDFFIRDMFEMYFGFRINQGKAFIISVACIGINSRDLRRESQHIERGVPAWDYIPAEISGDSFGDGIRRRLNIFFEKLAVFRFEVYTPRNAANKTRTLQTSDDPANVGTAGKIVKISQDKWLGHF